MDELVSMESSSNAMTEMNSDQLRAIQEIQASIIIAKKFPRDELKCQLEIVNACKRYALADVAFYEYPRGTTTVTGESIHLARVMAGIWGNLQYGINEIYQENGSSYVEAFCWDQQRNNRPSIKFWVKHERHVNEYVNKKKTGNVIVKKLTDPRDIYEIVANNGARRLRKCILDCLPRDVVEAAKERCNQTLREGSGKVTIKERLEKMLQAFQDEGVSKEMLETRYGHGLETTTEKEILEFQRIFRSLRDGETNVMDWFSDGRETQDIVSPDKKAQDFKEKMMGHKAEKTDEVKVENEKKEKK